MLVVVVAEVDTVVVADEVVCVVESVVVDECSECVVGEVVVVIVDFGCECFEVVVEVVVV